MDFASQKALYFRIVSATIRWTNTHLPQKRVVKKGKLYVGFM